MRVIRKGKEKEYIATCLCCGSDIVYTREDVQLIPCDVIGKGGAVLCKNVSSFNGLYCPECGASIRITYDEFYGLSGNSQESSRDINPYPQYSYNSGLQYIGNDKPVWGLDTNWVLWELQHGRNPLKQEEV